MRQWITRGFLGIIFATFFSDVGHEMVTATLPMYLGTIGLGAAALGFMEGFADLLSSLSKLAGGWVGHRSSKKREWATFGYLLTALGTGAIAITQSLAGLVSARSSAWLGRGFRSPLRDFMLSDEVGTTHYGRAYGIERAADMLGAVTGPFIAALLLWIGVSTRFIITASLIPSVLAAGFFFFMTKDRPTETVPAGLNEAGRLPRRFWSFSGGVALFGLGDFSRTFLIFLAAEKLGGVVSVVLLYAAHNAISAMAAYPAGYLGDRGNKSRILVIGYFLGVVTNVLLAWSARSTPLLLLAIFLSGIYIAIEETLEKAVAAEVLPREQRSLGLGVLSCSNAVGDMLSSVAVGALLASGHRQAAFLIPAMFGLAGAIWMAQFSRRPQPLT
jgi:MFS family permease